MSYNTYSAKYLRQLLRDNNIKGRSKATTLPLLENLCHQHNLLQILKDVDVELPNDILRVIITLIIKCMQQDLDAKFTLEKFTEYYQLYKNLSYTCKFLHSIMSEYWKDLLSLYTCYENVHHREARHALKQVELWNLSYIQALSLVVETGCQICGAKRIRKVYWPFKRRICQSCLYANTVSDYVLKTEYGLVEEDIADYEFDEREMYSKPANLYYTLKFYWCTSVVNAFNIKYDAKFQTVKSIKNYIAGKREIQVKEQETRVHEFASSLEIPAEILMQASKCFKDVASVALPTSQKVKDYKELILNQHTAWCRKQNVYKWIAELCTNATASSNPKFISYMQCYIDKLLIRKYSKGFGVTWTQDWFMEHFNHVFTEEYNKQMVKITKEEQETQKQLLNKNQKQLMLRNSLFNCNMCTNTSRNFTAFGLIDHQRAKHQVDVSLDTVLGSISVHD